jgi:DNA-binding XRE family transcriptional regulator
MGSMTHNGKITLEDSGLLFGPIDGDPDGMIAEIGVPVPDGEGGTSFSLTNLSLADTVKLRDWLSQRITATSPPPEQGSAQGPKRTLHLFAGTLARTRWERGWTQRELAERAGVDRKVINIAENEIAWPSPDQISRIETALGVHLQA